MAIRKDESIAKLIAIFGAGKLKSKNVAIDDQLREAEKYLENDCEAPLASWGKVSYDKTEYSRAYGRAYDRYDRFYERMI